MMPVRTIEPITANGTFFCGFFVSPANSTPWRKPR